MSIKKKNHGGKDLHGGQFSSIVIINLLYLGLKRLKSTFLKTPSLKNAGLF